MYPPKEERSLSDWNILCDSTAEIVILGYFVVQDIGFSGRELMDGGTIQLSISSPVVLKQEGKSKARSRIMKVRAMTDSGTCDQYTKECQPVQRKLVDRHLSNLAQTALDGRDRS